MDATQHVHEVLRQSFGVDAQTVPSDTVLQQVLLDSLALEEFRLLIEERLGIDLEAVPLTSRDTVGHLVDMVSAKASA
ncbi:phosphopantetheine-binding protein [Streptomyces sp. NPDC093510]|uniref:acyl carrier protein n=1 Tax=Streptomyces sp. NPDC093510 TaxID=3155199 RepID=UPI00341A8E3B